MNGPVRRSIGNNDNFVIDFFIYQMGINGTNGFPDALDMLLVCVEAGQS